MLISFLIENHILGNFERECFLISRFIFVLRFQFESKVFALDLKLELVYQKEFRRNYLTLFFTLFSRRMINFVFKCAIIIIKYQSK